MVREKRYMIIPVIGFTEQKHCLKAGRRNTQGKNTVLILEEEAEKRILKAIQAYKLTEFRRK